MPPEAALRQKTIALVGLMGVGKSSLGRRLATALDMPFSDADEQIERAAGCSIADIFAERGEAEFREGERRVIARMLEEPPHVMATGGGAFLHPSTRQLILDKAISIWLNADVSVLVRRVARKNDRPLLNGRDPTAVLTQLAREREPFYSQADIHIATGDKPHQTVVEALLEALREHLKRSKPE